MKTAFMFPGQGVQVVGMGKDFYENYAEAKQVDENASEIFEIDMKKLWSESSQKDLNKTENTQIAIAVTSLAILKVIKSLGIKEDFNFGLSLGEYVALIEAGIISFDDGLKLLRKRGYYMGNFLPKEDFLMLAVIGLESKKIEEICSNIDGFVVPANYNYSNQTVISGNLEAVKEAENLLKQAGAKKVIPLNTSGPFHTIKLRKASEMFSKDLDKIEFKEPKNKVIKNLDGTEYTKNDNIKEILAKHIISPVRFDKILELMKKEHVDRFIEIGPGKALSGFVRKEMDNVEIYSINSIEALKKLN